MSNNGDVLQGATLAPILLIPGLEARNLLYPLEIGVVVEKIKIIVDGRLGNQEIDGTSDDRPPAAQLK